MQNGVRTQSEQMMRDLRNERPRRRKDREDKKMKYKVEDKREEIAPKAKVESSMQSEVKNKRDLELKETVNEEKEG